jgi:hypothetical protein
VNIPVCGLNFTMSCKSVLCVLFPPKRKISPPTAAAAAA